MVNFEKLTVSKLSQLQKLILSKISDNAGEGLAHVVACEFRHNRRPETIKRDEFDITWYNDNGFFTASQKSVEDPNRMSGDGSMPILSSKFKASYYRSVKRLKNRGLVEKVTIGWYDDIVKAYRHYNSLVLTDSGKQVVLSWGLA